MSDLQCPARVYLARHAEAAYDAPGGGGPADGPLSPRGEGQARALGEELRGARIARVYASTMPRATRTGSLAAAALGVEVEELEALVEIGAVPDESAADVVSRMIAALEEIADQHRGEAVLVVGHLAAIGLTLPHLLNGSETPAPGLDAGDWIALEGDADGWVLRP